MYNLTERALVLGVTGSISVYKSVDLASKLTQAGALVDVVMTKEAAEFVSPITFKSVTGRPVYWDMWDSKAEVAEPHVALARRADVIVIAPATATILARLAAGLADDMVSLTVLASQSPVVVCPAMDSQMWQHPATQHNIAVLQERGVRVIGPEEGRLASGQVGRGRLSEVETIMGGIRTVIGASGDLAGKKVVISAGGTHEAIDPVRYIGNRSSGKMGFALAEAARDRGALVSVVSGPVALPDPYGVGVTRVQRAAEMRDAITSESAQADVLIMAAAVADYQPAEAVGEKIKREDRDSLMLPLVRTPDILSEIGTRPGLIRVGFAAESQELLANAAKKLEAKDLDIIVANDITASDAGFSADNNRVVLLERGRSSEELPLMTKYEVAWRILDRVAARLAKNEVADAVKEIP